MVKHMVWYNDNGTWRVFTDSVDFTTAMEIATHVMTKYPARITRQKDDVTMWESKIVAECDEPYMVRITRAVYRGRLIPDRKVG